MLVIIKAHYGVIFGMDGYNSENIELDQKQPLISVVIACRNAEKYITSCLDSIVLQTYKNIEIIICDDASTDTSLSLLKEYAKRDTRIIVLQNSKNIFQAATRNKCIENSNGEYIVIQDIDDISRPNRIEKLLKELTNNNGIDFVSCNMEQINEENKIVGEYRTVRKEYPDKKDFLIRLPFSHATTMFRRSCLEFVGGYRVSKETRRSEDYDLFVRLYAAGFRGKNISDSLYLYRVNAGTIERRSFKMRIDECVVRYHGYKALGLMPQGLIYIIRPILAHIVNEIKWFSVKRGKSNTRH